MCELQHLFDSNKKWADEKKAHDPSVFKELSKGQTPKYLWFGCSDSRVPANEILGLRPGELFVQRNVANLFPHTDFNCLSALQYGVDYLDVEHVIVCGHYGCGGVRAAMEANQFGLVDNWLRQIKDIYFAERKTLEAIADPEARYKKLVELNVHHQVLNVCHTTIIQNAWARDKKLSVHGWVYDISTGLLTDLECSISSLAAVEEVYHTKE